MKYDLRKLWMQGQTFLPCHHLFFICTFFLLVRASRLYEVQTRPIHFRRYLRNAQNTYFRRKINIVIRRNPPIQNIMQNSTRLSVRFLTTEELCRSKFQVCIGTYSLYKYQILYNFLTKHCSIIRHDQAVVSFQSCI